MFRALLKRCCHPIGRTSGGAPSLLSIAHWAPPLHAYSTSFASSPVTRANARHAIGKATQAHFLVPRRCPGTMAHAHGDAQRAKHSNRTQRCWSAGHAPPGPVMVRSQTRDCTCTHKNEKIQGYCTNFSIIYSVDLLLYLDRTDRYAYRSKNVNVLQIGSTLKLFNLQPCRQRVV